MVSFNTNPNTETRDCIKRKLEECKALLERDKGIAFMAAVSMANVNECEISQFMVGSHDNCVNMLYGFLSKIPKQILGPAISMLASQAMKDLEAEG